MSSLADINRLTQSDLEGRWEEVLHQLLVSFLLIFSDSCCIVKGLRLNDIALLNTLSQPLSITCHMR